MMDIYVVVMVHIEQYYPSGEAQILYAGTNKELAFEVFSDKQKETSPEEWSLRLEMWRYGKRTGTFLREE